MDAGDWAALDEAAEIIETFPHGQTMGSVPHSWISEAVAQGAKSAVAWMLARGVDPSPEGDHGFPPLHVVIDLQQASKYEILALLIAAGADVNQHGLNDWTPLHRAATRDETKMMQMLLDAGADRSRRTRIDNYATPADEARRLGHIEAADFIDAYGS